jgi:hypothetical protein
MTHDEFRNLFYKNRRYYVEQIPDSWNWDSKWIYVNSLSNILDKIGLDIRSWYSIYVARPSCVVCGSPSKMLALNRGWGQVCDSEICSSDHKKLVMKENSEFFWREGNHRELISNLDRTNQSKLLEDKWRSPEFRRDIYVKQMNTKGILFSQVYVGIGDIIPIKFGAGDGEGRLYHRGLNPVWISDLMPIEKAAELEYVIAINVPQFEHTHEQYVVNGRNEIRELGQLDDILDVVDKWCELNL